jgi:lysine 2,3-aminomutase
LRNFEGVNTSYPEPGNYVPGRTEDYFKGIYSDYEKYQSNVGIDALMNDSKFNLISEELNRLNRRKKYQEDTSHSSLKDKSGKREELKEKPPKGKGRFIGSCRMDRGPLGLWQHLR